MAKKQSANRGDRPRDEEDTDALAADSQQDPGEQDPDESPEVSSAADAVARAEAELKKACDVYHKVRDEAAERLKGVREATVGDVLDGTLKMVKKHPGPGVLVAAVVGFFLGRLFRR